MIPENFFFFLLMTTAVSLAPGPNTMFVMSQAALRGPRAGILAGLGIEVVNIGYFALVALGLASIVAASTLAFEIMKWGGAAYLLALGSFVIYKSFRADDDLKIEVPHHKAGRSAFRDGVFIALGNPKTIIYFLTLVPPFIDPTRDVLGQTFVIGLTGSIIDVGAQALYCVAGGTLSRLMNHPHIKRWFERGVGVAFVALSLVVALYKK